MAPQPGSPVGRGLWLCSQLDLCSEPSSSKDHVTTLGSLGGCKDLT